MSSSVIDRIQSYRQFSVQDHPRAVSQGSASSEPHRSPSQRDTHRLKSALLSPILASIATNFNDSTHNTSENNILNSAQQTCSACWAIIGIPWLDKRLQHGLPKKAIKVRVARAPRICLHCQIMYAYYLDRAPRLEKEADARDRAADPGIGLTGEGGLVFVYICSTLV